MRLLSIGLVALLLPSVAEAQLVISNLNGPDAVGTAFGGGATTQYKAYGFTMGGTDVPLGEVIIRLNPGGPSPMPVVELYDDAGGTPGNAIVGLDGPTVFPMIDDYSFEPSAPVTLSASTSYWIYVTSPTPGADTFTWVGGNNVPAGPLAAHVGYEFNGAISLFLNKVEVLGGTAGSIGTSYCSPAAVNSTGQPGAIGATGSPAASANALTLTASDLPLNQFGIFVTSTDQAFVPGAGGTSNGNLCLGGSVGRFSLPSQILSSGTSGEFSLSPSLTSFPQGSSFVAVAAGETWNFQAWYRDAVGLGSNFTDGIEITFQ